MSQLVNIKQTLIHTAVMATLACSVGSAYAVDGVTAINNSSIYLASAYSGIQPLYSHGAQISADGTTVIYATGAGGISQFWRWRSSSGWESVASSTNSMTWAGGAMGLSADGNVLVGVASSLTGSTARAYRWTSATGLVDLGNLGGVLGTTVTTAAYGVTPDGNTVVGTAQNVDGKMTAFQWTQATGMTSLGLLNAGLNSAAYAVNTDGSVIVGRASDGAAANGTRAFRWTSSTGMVSLGTLNSGTSSWANDVSGDGSVVVGRAQDGANGNLNRAFRWTATDGMVSLGTLAADNTSIASGISSDGSVIVGVSQGAGQSSGFRWTQATGMVSVAQWLSDNGVTVPAGMILSTATGTNADGSVVVGNIGDLVSGPYIARVSPIGSGLIDISNFYQSIEGAGSLPTYALNDADIVLHGAHGSPMRSLLPEGQSSVWMAGDWGHATHDELDGNLGAGELGWTRNLGQGYQVKLAVGTTYDKQNFSLGGDARFRGVYLVPELIWNPVGNIYATFSGYYNHGDVDVKRGYLNAGVMDYSDGDANVNTLALRARIDWLNAISYADTDLTPYVSVTTARTRINGFTENGGGFPVRWDGRKETSNILRAGVDAVHPIAGSRVSLLGRMEGAWRAEREGTNVSGQILGLNNFDFAGNGYRRSWLRAGVGAEGAIDSGIGSLMLNVTTQGGAPDYWLAASYRLGF